MRSTEYNKCIYYWTIQVSRKLLLHKKICLFRATLSRQWHWQSSSSICNITPSSMSDRAICSCLISTGTFAVTSDMFDPDVCDTCAFPRMNSLDIFLVAFTDISIVSIRNLLLHWCISSHIIRIGYIDHVELSSVILIEFFDRWKMKTIVFV